jgi:tetratricopeptide (TPR) repeat protein
MKLLRGSLPVVAAALLASPALPQDWKGQGRIEGKVLDEKGQPLADVIVRGELPGRGKTETKTDKKGKWVIGGAAGGDWNLDFESPGYLTKRITTTVQESARGRPIELKLEKVPGPPPEVIEALNKGDEAYKAERWSEAREHYEKLLAHELIQSRPDVMKNLRLQLARCYSQEKNYAKELEHLEAVIAADPGNAQLRILAANEALQGDAALVDKGIELLKGVDESAVTNPDVFFNIAVAFFNKQKMDEAITYYTKAVTLSPTYADGYYFRGNAYVNQGKMAEAKADYKKFLEVAPPDDARIESVKKVVEQLK